ncbi:hypothetical protein ACH4T9_02985 [Micromonospora sp. NPDC020750]|uniref:helix-turn-helix transcriptional regulator n=1 Tax=unclassified Micromonospora TaxID=2617518 RepID=UPI0037A617F8
MQEVPYPLPGLGLSQTEQALYETLVAGPGSVPAEVTGTDDFARLLELGLVTRLPGQPSGWWVTPPDAAFGPHIARHRLRLYELRQRLDRMTEQKRVTASDSTALVEVTHSLETSRAMFEDLVRHTEREVLICDAPPYLNGLQRKQPANFVSPRRGVRVRTLYDRESLALPGSLAHIAASIEASEEVRVTDVPMKLMICDGRRAMVPLRLRPLEMDRFLLVHDPVLLAALTALFESFWEQAVPLSVGVRLDELPDADAPSGLERDLLALMMSGLTDQAIAKHLDYHVGTTRRHIRQLLTRLGATTRFQAGYQAVQRGWIAADDRTASLPQEVQHRSRLVG